VSAQLDLGAATRTLLTVGDMSIATLQAGEPTAPPVLLVPGYTGSKEDFAPLLDPLAAGGFRVTAIDLPGQFESPGPTEPARYSVAELGATVLRLAQRLGPAVRLLGHSFGGLVSRAAVCAEPTAFASLVLVGSGPAALQGPRRAMIDRLEPVLAGQGMPAVYAATQAFAAAQPGYRAPSSQLAAFLRRRFLAGSPAMLRGMGDALRAEPDRVDELAATGVPVLVLYGAADDAWPVEVQAAMAARLGAAIAVIPNAMHSPAIENPAATSGALLRFWAPPPTALCTRQRR
jgi:pimeloyl-ACP methyl ester carboxylesterase